MSEERRDTNVKIIAIEEHWNSAGIRAALDRLPAGARDESVAFNAWAITRPGWRTSARAGSRRWTPPESMLRSCRSSPPPPRPSRPPTPLRWPGTRTTRPPAPSGAHPGRFRAFATLPTSDPQAAAAELERCASQLGHVGAMVHGRTGPRPLDDPAYDDLFATAARWHQPVFIHPQIPSDQLRDAAYRGLDPLVDLGLATFGWGWHLEAGLAALRLILRGTFDRHPGLQVVLGHWGEMLLFWMDRADSLSGVARHLERRVSDYITTTSTSPAAGCCRSACCATRSTSPAPTGCCSPPTTRSTSPMRRRSGSSSTPSPTRARVQIASANAEALFGLA